MGASLTGMLYCTPMRIIDLSGRRFGRLVVQTRTISLNHKATWICLCDCGNTHTVRSGTLLKGEVRSCGCFQRETRGQHRRTHGASRTSVYRTWTVAKGRCYNPTDPHYDRYGARGIQMCDAWRQSFQAFFAAVGPRPPHTSLDRINNDGHYEPGNVRWATAKQQGRNQTRTVRVVHQGEALTIGEWAERTGLHASLLYYRIRQAGWTVAEALTTPSQKKQNPK